MKQFVCLSLLLLFASEFLLIADSDHPGLQSQEACVTDRASVQTQTFEYPYGYSEKSRALVDELREIHPLFGDICNQNSSHPYACESAIKTLENFKEKRTERYDCLDYYAKYNLKNIPLDPIEREHYKEQELKKTKQEIDRSMRKKYPYEPGKAQHVGLFSSVSLACLVSVILRITLF